MKHVAKYLGALALLAFTSTTSASSDSLDSRLAEWEGMFDAPADESVVRDVLPPLEAFELVAWHDREQIYVGMAAQPDHYLYRPQLSLNTTLPNGDVVPTEAFTAPVGVTKDDPFFGSIATFPAPVVATASLSSPLDRDTTLSIDMTFQGCADALGICYPMTDHALTAEYQATPPAVFQSAAYGDTSLGQAAPAVSASATPLGGDRFMSAMHDASLPIVMGVFFLAGLALTVTPCVLPMLPILSSIVVGRKATPRQAFTLSSAYVAGVIATYTALGVAMGVLGSGLNIQGYLQSPPVLLAFAALFLALALMMAGVVALPQGRGTSALQSRVSRWQDMLQTMGVKGTAGAGALSVLVVSPCVSAPLAATLVFISTKGDALLGGLALMALSSGMSVPLLLAGTFGARLLPKAGAWMNTVKVAFAFMLAGVSIWLLARLLSPALSLVLWSALAFAVGAYLWRASRSRAIKATACAPFAWGLMMLIGAGVGSHSPLAPLSGMWEQTTTAETTTTVSTLPSLQALMQAHQHDADEPVMVVFKADWCASCAVMERRLQAPDVVAALEGIHRIDVDLTQNNQDTRDVMRECNLFAPPAVMFFDNGKQLSDWNLYGEVSERALLQHLERVKRAAL